MQMTHMLPKNVDNGSPKKLKWKIVEPNEDGRFNCLDCKETFSNRWAARQHHKMVHMMENKFICKICNIGFQVEEHMIRHVKNTHMLPKIVDNGSKKKLKWRIVEDSTALIAKEHFQIGGHLDSITKWCIQNTITKNNT